MAQVSAGVSFARRAIMTKGKEVHSFSFHGFNGRSRGRPNLHLMPASAGSVKGYSPPAACWSWPRRVARVG